MFKKAFFTLFILTIIAAACGGGALYWLIVIEPGDEIRAENIRNILGRESSVFYNDGQTKLGVFFDTAHRQYVNYNEIPSEFVNALVASEDDRFFEHYGFDIVGISRAMMKNIQAGRVVQGGSTLTQQTAKNLFKRTKRSYEAKLKELLYALRLEFHYSKEEIFEFYANQFYVSGNGHGLGVAARYYFDKKPAELTLLECAFIAGSVKRPNYYNPFRNSSPERSKVTQARAKVRLRYVLRKMRQLGMIDNFTYKGALAEQLVFKNGQVGYSLDHAMELVRDAVSSSGVRQALELHGISNIATSGIRVITSIDSGLQQKSLSALRGELSRLDVRLRGYERETIQEELRNLTYTGDSAVRDGNFLFGKIKAIEGERNNIRITVALDKKLGEGVIEAAGLKKIVTARVKYHKNRWTEPGKKDLPRLVEQLKLEDRVWVRVVDDGTDRESEPEQGEEAVETKVVLALEKFPLLQGASIVVQDGKIRALAGGNENRFFNRAIHAKRTMGSAFKPLVYAAAMQLGWNNTDLLRNTRDLFVYQDQPYFPRPDHKIAHDWVSMSWAGVHSENVASVWLLSRLCEKLTPLQFREVAEHLGLAPKIVDGEKEPYRTYSARIRDRLGIQVNKKILREAAYYLAVKNLETDFIFDNMVEEYGEIKKLHYGRNFDKYQEQLDERFAKEKIPVKKRIVAEYKLRTKILSRSYLKFEKFRNTLTELRQLLAFGGIDLVREQDVLEAAKEEPKEEDSGSLYLDRMTNVFYFLSRDSEITGVVPVSTVELQNYLQHLDGQETAQFWRDIQFENGLRVEVFDKLRQEIEFEYAKLLKKLPFDFEVLTNIRDFRITVGLNYLIALGDKFGIKSRLEPILSFPLGSNVISLFEATRMYEAMVTGELTKFTGVREDQYGNEVAMEENGDVLAVIDRIESDDGKILFEPDGVTTKVVDHKTSLMVGSILENIVKFGTGRYAGRHVKFTGGGAEAAADIEDLSLSVPLLGKTGTANNYTNASFLGYIPEVADNRIAMTLKDGYAVGVYVGFDDNSPMRKGNSRISGSAGALPCWSQLANAIQLEKNYAARLDPVDLSFYGLGIKRRKLGQINLGVDKKGGGIVNNPAVTIPEISRNQASILTFGKISDRGRFAVARNYQPFWDN